MAAPNIVNALVAWATDDDIRIAQIRSARDECAEAIITGKPLVTLTNSSLNGKSFSGIARLSLDDKFALFHSVLTALGEVTDEQPSVTYGNFYDLQR